MASEAAHCENFLSFTELNQIQTAKKKANDTSYNMNK